MNKTQRQITAKLANLGIFKAVAGFGSIDGASAVILRWNGKEEYVTLYDVEDPYRSTEDTKHCNWLVANFSDNNLDNSRDWKSANRANTK